MIELNGYQKKLVLEAIESYTEKLELQSEMVEDLKLDFHVTQELDEKIDDIRVKVKSLSELNYKFY